MKNAPRLFLVLVLMLTLGGCSEWEELVDSISGSGDDEVATPAGPADSTGIESPAGTETPSDTEATSGQETGNYHGRFNGDRPHWYYSRNMKDYPSEFYLTISGCTSRLKVSHNGSRWESGGYLAKQSDVSGRGMVVLGPSSCGSRESYIAY